jgi:hypothetical protein
LIDKNMNKQDLKELSGVSTTSIAKLGKGENITMDCDSFFRNVLWHRRACVGVASSGI